MLNPGIWHCEIRVQALPEEYRARDCLYRDSLPALCLHSVCSVRSEFVGETDVRDIDRELFSFSFLWTLVLNRMKIDSM